MPDTCYDENFYRAQKDGSFNSAKIIIPIVQEFIKPRTVMDFGCGLGTWLAVWKSHGAKVIGVDGDYVERDMLYIDEESFISADLSKDFVKVDHKVDLVESLEVAEHLPESRAVEFVHNLTEVSDVVLFSAAFPYQGGTNHINEQWPSYWANIFSAFGYIPVDCIRTQPHRLAGCILCYANNIMFYVREQSLSKYPLLLDWHLRHRDALVLDFVNAQTWQITMENK